MTMLPAHPAADLFPMMSDADLQALAADIAANGQRDPVVIHDGLILDGRNRWRACEIAGKKAKTRQWDGQGGSPTLYVLSTNLQRRHLAEGQRAMVAALALPMLEAEARERQKILLPEVGKAGAAFGHMGGRGHKREETPCVPTGTQGVSETPAMKPRKPKHTPQRSAAKAGKAAGAAPRSVGRAKRVAEKAPELAEKVRNGEMTLGAAEHQVRETEKQEKAAVVIAATPVTDACLQVADATEPWPMGEQRADLIFTSPPYGLDKSYHGIEDSAEGWEAFTHDWLTQAYAAAADTGRLALNVPLDTSEPTYRPTWPQACAAAVAAGWTYRSCILWAKGNSTKGNRGLGSENSADAPHPIVEVEVIGLFSKGAWKKAVARPSDITPEDWQAWGNGLWEVAGESHPWEGHPASFPEALARRVIVYLSRVGDVVVDPFVGSGTTVLVARRRKRVPLGFDQSAEYIAAASRRLAQDGEQHAERASQEQFGFDVPSGEPGRVDHQHAFA